MDEEGEEEMNTGDVNMSNVPILLDLSFTNNIRYLGRQNCRDNLAPFCIASKEHTEKKEQILMDEYMYIYS